MQQKHLVSVIVIFLNASDFLQEAIESVLAQTYEHWELLLVDDGSSDGSTEIAMSFASENSAQIKYFEHDDHQNLGMSAARNLGIRNAKGDYIAFLDADDYWLPNKLDVQTSVLDSQPDAGMLFGSTKYWFSWTGSPEDSQRDYVPSLRVRTHTLFHLPLLFLLFIQGKAEVPCTCSILVRRAVAEKIGGFEESFRGMYEDQAFYAKICLYTPVLATDDCLALYRQHSKSNYSTAIHSGQTDVLRYRFLKWLETYCHEKQIQDKSVWEAVRRQLWLYDSSSHQKLPGFAQDSIRWIKKWILRVEERFLPSSLRDWLWIRN
ncbi:MAG: glycosyltransferase family 2 protein [Chloroflexota bacterium]|nr:glycosyltransferase family 2 protein [Chloroflexota bacterium]